MANNCVIQIHNEKEINVFLGFFSPSSHPFQGQYSVSDVKLRLSQ